MESSQVVCSSPLFCKLEPESPPSWDSVEFTESNFGEYWPDDWEDDKDNVGIKNLSPSDILLDLDLLMKEEPFTWIDERNENLYTSFDWSPSDVKVFNISSSTTATPADIDAKPFTNNITVPTSTVVGHGFNSAAPTGNSGKLFQNSMVTTTTSSQLPLATQTPDLLREFEDVFINGSSDSLTPPESPRYQNASLITLLQDIEPCTSSSNEIDAIVATQAENMVPHNPNHQQQNKTQDHEHQAPLSPDPWSSPSIGSSSSDSGYDDPDWSPSSPITTTNDNNIQINTINTNKTSIRRKRSAVTTTEERKLRKKEQNKNAATRYRQKKKQEIEIIIGEERELIDKHEKLRADVTELTREIKYLKSLLRDLYKAKGLIS